MLAAVELVLQGSLNIFVKNLLGKTIVIAGLKSDTVDDLTRGIENQEGMPPDHQRFPRPHYTWFYV